MKLLFFSDVHGSPDSLRLLMQHADHFQPDRYVLLGDALYHGPRNPLRSDYAPPKAVEYLNALTGKIIAVRGNCDSEVDQMLISYPMMSDYSMIWVEEKSFFLTHGHLWDPAKLPPIGMGEIFVYGHTHLPDLRKLECGVTVLNPGSISLPKGGNPPSFGTYEKGVLRILNLENGSEMKVLEV